MTRNSLRTVNVTLTIGCQALMFKRWYYGVIVPLLITLEVVLPDDFKGLVPFIPGEILLWEPLLFLSMFILAPFVIWVGLGFLVKGMLHPSKVCISLGFLILFLFGMGYVRKANLGSGWTVVSSWLNGTLHFALAFMLLVNVFTTKSERKRRK